MPGLPDVTIAVVGHAVVDLVPAARVRECREDNNTCVFVIDNPISGIDVPTDVGGALRVRDHGSPFVPTLTAVLDWSLDEGAPRVGQHFHVLRGTRPDAFVRELAWEPLVETSVTDGTPSAGSGGERLHFYSIRAADDCEQESDG